MRKLIYIFLLAIGSVFLHSGCSGSGSPDAGAADEEKPEDFEAALVLIDDLLADTLSSPWDETHPMPDDNCIKLRIDYPGGTLKSLFRDSNHLHLQAAQAIGIEPIYGDSVRLPLRRPLEKIRSTSLYAVDELRHSYPYLVPEARQLLDEVAKRFHDTLQARGGGPYRLKVTSLLRTHHSVKKLRRVNRASVDSSAHLFGTTFDISFTNFPYDGGEPHRTQEDLKNLLAEILYKFRQEGRCYIIYERKPGCFHITARP